MKGLVTRLLSRRRDEGASAVEYGLLVALIAVIIAGAVALLGNTLSERFNCAVNSITDGASAECDGGQQGGSGN